MSRAGVLARVVVGALFLWAGMAKIVGPDRFVDDILSYRLVPHALAAAMAWYLPPLEIMAGACLVAGRMVPGALAVAGGLMAVFTAALLQAWARGLDIQCGCFGGGGGTSQYLPWLARDAAIMAAVAWAAWADRLRSGH